MPPCEISARRWAPSVAPEAALPTWVETVTRTLRVPCAAILLKPRRANSRPRRRAAPCRTERLALPLAYAGASLGDSRSA